MMLKELFAKPFAQDGARGDYMLRADGAGEEKSAAMSTQEDAAGGFLVKPERKPSQKSLRTAYLAGRSVVG